MTEGELENLGLGADGGSDGAAFGEELADLSAPERRAVPEDE
jgi:hypothetical protein